jgi:hypothetical protein
MTLSRTVPGVRHAFDRAPHKVLRTDAGVHRTQLLIVGGAEEGKWGEQRAGADAGDELEGGTGVAVAPSDAESSRNGAIMRTPETARKLEGGKGPFAHAAPYTVRSRPRAVLASCMSAGPWVSGQKRAFGIPSTVACSVRFNGTADCRSKAAQPTMSSASNAAQTARMIHDPRDHVLARTISMCAKLLARLLRIGRCPQR